MMLEFELSLFINGHRKVISSPSWEDVHDSLKKLKGNAGSLYLEVVNLEGDGPERLSIESDGYYYMITLLEFIGGEGVVRTLNNFDAPTGNVMINGDCWCEKQVTTNFDVVYNLLYLIFFTGAIPIEMLT
ncbi:DUF6911 family protein [Erwinia sp.]|uniref:DUF6911 family protein n=1 Tax=Erwinia citreus TaxID=558 RepID=UPI0028A1E90F|nr:hypothetical protein [Erwinia sp.]